MKRSHWVIGSALTLALAAAASGCVVRARPAPVVVSAGVTVDGSSDYATVYPTTFAPEPIPEYRPAPPGYGYSWVDGYWDWTGYDWTWSSGYWVPERVGYAYIAPRYIYVDGRPVYYRGYWQGDNGYREYGYGGYRGAPPAAWRGQPQAAPTVWRSQPAHTQWRGTATTAAPPPAGGWRGGASTPPPATGFRGTPTTSTAPPPAGAWHGGAAPGPAGPATAPPPAGNGWRGATAGPGPSTAPPPATPPGNQGWHGGGAAPAPGPAGAPATAGWHAGAAPGPGRRRRRRRRCAARHGLAWSDDGREPTAGTRRNAARPGRTASRPVGGRSPARPRAGERPAARSSGWAPARDGWRQRVPPAGSGLRAGDGRRQRVPPAGSRPCWSRLGHGRRPHLRRRRPGWRPARPQHGRAGRRPARADAGAHGAGPLARQQEVNRAGPNQLEGRLTGAALFRSRGCTGRGPRP